MNHTTGCRCAADAEKLRLIADVRSPDLSIHGSCGRELTASQNPIRLEAPFAAAAAVARRDNETDSDIQPPTALMVTRSNPAFAICVAPVIRSECDENLPNAFAIDATSLTTFEIAAVLIIFPFLVVKIRASGSWKCCAHCQISFAGLTVQLISSSIGILSPLPTWSVFDLLIRIVPVPSSSLAISLRLRFANLRRPSQCSNSQTHNGSVSSHETCFLCFAGI